MVIGRRGEGETGRQGDKEKEIRRIKK